ncbi:MAG: hypothetical protein IPK01_00375 [Acidobacteria bacterium]|nr:hypothetical protein [Acidobacteriota bacterium]
MMNDTVREELQPKAVTSGNLPMIEPAAIKVPEPRPYVERPNPYAVPPPASTVMPPVQATAIKTAAVTAKRVETAGLTVAKTSPTLVEFQNKNTSLPDWRLQLQNAVRQRKGTSTTSAVSEMPHAVASPTLRTNGANALKAEPAPEPLPENADPRLNAALRRIADSRSSFLPAEPAKTAFAPRETTHRNFRFDVIEPSPDAAARPTLSRGAVNALPKPTLVAPARAEKFDTNKLPKLEEIAPKKIEKVEAISTTRDKLPNASEPEFDSIKRIFISAESIPAEENTENSEIEEIEDLAVFDAFQCRPIRPDHRVGRYDGIVVAACTFRR